MRTISAILRASLLERGAQKALAVALDVEQSTVSNWVNGRNEPAADRWHEIEDHLGLERHTIARAKAETDDPLPDDAALLGKPIAQIRETSERLSAGLERLEGFEARLGGLEARLSLLEQAA